MKQVFKYILALLLVLSCNNNSIEKPKKPKDLIKKNKMVDIIYDMSIFTAAKGINKKLIEEKGVFPEDYIFSKHNVDSLQFAKSSEYYAYRLEVYEDIYSKVKLKLDERKLFFDSIENAETEQKRLETERKQAKRDSLKKFRQELSDEKPLKQIEGLPRGVNLNPFENISEWRTYIAGKGVTPDVIDNEVETKDGDMMAYVRLDLDGGKLITDRSAIILDSIPFVKGDYIYSFWAKAKTKKDIGKTIRIIPEVSGGVETIHTLSSEPVKVEVLNHILEEGEFKLLIEIRGVKTNSDIVEFYLWDVKVEQVLNKKKSLDKPVLKNTDKNRN